MALFDQIPGQTRIKICGLTKPEQVDLARQLAIDAIGLVFYQPSSRYISPVQAGILSNQYPHDLDTVALVVNATDQEILEIKKHCRVDIWQFHGDETAQRCQDIAQGMPWMKAARIDEKFQLDEFCLQYRDANAWLLDAVIDGYGGGGQTFNWDMIDSLWIKENAHRVVLSGGLNVKNVGNAIAYFHPLAVDISSGVEVEKGLKDPYLMKAFVAQVRLFDQPDKH